MEYEKYIWDWLWERLGNECGVAGLMGNLAAESGLRADNLQNSFESALGMTDEEYREAVDSGVYSKESFVYDRAGFGIGQWTHPERKLAMYTYAKDHGKSIGDLTMQLEFLMYELGKSYLGVLQTLLNAKTVREASDAVMLKYEVPADTSEKNRERRAAIGETYLEKFGKEEREDLKRNDKAEKIVQLAEERIGCPYVFGAKGGIVNGKQVFDCRGYTWWLLQQVGISISDVGATTQWNRAEDWEERGRAEDMPNLVCCVFKYHEEDGKMSHTGMHVGDGKILHCTSNEGVKWGSMTDKSWTHYAIPKGLYTEEEIEEARPMNGQRTLRKGCSGEDVAELQRTLMRMGYQSVGKADGIFGMKTEEAVKSFQGYHGLTVDGIVGEKTMAKIREITEPDPEEKEQPAKETPVLRDYVKLPLSQAMNVFMTLAEQLGYTVDARSGNVSPIDYQ